MYTPFTLEEAEAGLKKAWANYHQMDVINQSAILLAFMGIMHWQQIIQEIKTDKLMEALNEHNTSKTSTDTEPG